MIITARGYADLQKKTYEELLVERDELIDEVREYEKNPDEDDLRVEGKISPPVAYQASMTYLSIVCSMIAQKHEERINEKSVKAILEKHKNQ